MEVFNYALTQILLLDGVPPVIELKFFHYNQ